MHASVRSAAIRGVDAVPVDVEADITTGLPSFTTVGLPHGAVREGRERVVAAITNGGFQVPLRRITVNLAPSDLRKEGSAFDLPIALAVLAASGQLTPAPSDDLVVVGELGLEGDLRPARGVLSIALSARRAGARAILVPAANAAEAALVEGLEVFGAATLREACGHLAGTAAIRATPHQVPDGIGVADDVDLSDVRSQAAAKRALEVAAAGSHNLLLIGPPGAGKTMLARRLSTILPRFTLDEAIETTRIHSVAGLLPSGAGLVHARPFRAPHHTVSDAGLIGGGSNPRPGEVSLAHGGVLYLDELAEFRANVLEALRQPLEDGSLTVSRAAVALTFPSRVMLVASMNPCPCGYHGEPDGRCHCPPAALERYRGRLSGPLLDRIDIHLRVPAVSYGDLAGGGAGETSAVVRSRVEAARARQRDRFAGREQVRANAHMTARDVRLTCAMTPEAERLLRAGVTKFGLSARAYHRVLKVARTVADLAGADQLQLGHVAEALQYRLLDRGLVVAPAELRV